MNLINEKLPLLAPSMLSADFSNPSEGLALIESAKADWVHLDVMDGHFVPNLTFGPKFIADLRKRSKLPFDVHLMIEKPELSVDEYIKAGSDYVTFHAEACMHSFSLLQHIQSQGVKPGISLIPSSPVNSILELLPLCKLVLVMTVNPGFGGQTLIKQTLDKVSTLQKIRLERGLDFLISIDGGVNRATMPLISSVKPDVLVAGSAFFSKDGSGSFIEFCRDSWK